MNRNPVYSLAILPAHPLVGGDEIRRLAEPLGMAPLDIRLRASGGRVGILERSDDQAALIAKQGQITRSGHAAQVIGDREVEGLPWPFAARGVRIGREAVEFLDAERRVLATLGRGDDLLLLTANLQVASDRSIPMNPAQATAPDLSAVAADAAHELEWLLASPREGLVLDLAWNGGATRVRMRANRLEFSSLGEMQTPSATRNLAAILGAVVSTARSARVDLEYRDCQAPRLPQAPIPIGTGREFDRPRDDADEAWESYVRFVTTLWKGGLFNGPTAAGTFEGHPFLLTRTAMERGAPGAESEAEAIRREVPLWVPPPDPVTSVSDPLMAFVRRIGPPGIVVPLAAIAFGSFFLSVPMHSARLLIGSFFLFGLLTLVHALAQLDRRRRIEDVPTSRIRSAAIGPVEIHGIARAASPMRTPFSRMPCVWYEYKVIRRNMSAAPGVSGTSWSIRIETSSSSGTTEVQIGSSGEVPFHLEDATGRVEVDPRGAQIDVSSVQTFHQVPFDGGPLPQGTKVEITERYIPVDQPLYVMGELRVLPHDAGTDPTGAPEEPGFNTSRFRATARTDRVVLGRTATTPLFIISERSEKEVIGRMAASALLWLLAGSVVMVASLFELIRAFTPGGH